MTPGDKQSPPTGIRIRDTWRRFVEGQQLRMADVEALPQLALVGVFSGLVAGAVIILFRWLVETGQTLLLPGGADGFESLPPLLRLLSCVAGGAVIGLIFQFAPAGARGLGVVHVIERLNYHQGQLPLRNAFMQFIGAGLSLLAGHSAGREGPSIHLGATTASWLGRRLALPHNSMHTLVGCGVAAAIAAGFNTPLAGVVFAMEVVLLEYTIVGFAPIILAAVSAASLSRLVYGEDVVFLVPALVWDSVAELPYVLLLGVLIGLLAALFIQLLVGSLRLVAAYPVWVRMTLGGLAVGLLALVVPEVMGVGYDTLNSTLLGELGLTALALVLVAKTLATGVSLGFGLPGGLIAPTLVIGAAAGGLLGTLATVLSQDNFSHGFYAMVGMAAMMGATLQAPLAALMALLELTANPNIILPAMIAVIAAMLVTRVGCATPSVYQVLMRYRGLDYRSDPVAQALRRIGVASVMDRKVAPSDRVLSRADAAALLADHPRWILVRDGHRVPAMLPAADLARLLKDDDDPDRQLDLLEIPAQRYDLERTTIVASLQDAQEQLDRAGKQALYVTGNRGAGRHKIYGVLTRGDIANSYRP